MDVLAIDRDSYVPRRVARSAPAPHRHPLDTIRRARARATARLLRHLGSGRPDGDVAVRRNLLLTYTGAQILLGVAALAWVTVAVPIGPALDPGLDGTALAGPAGGLLLWVMFGLVGSLRALPTAGGEIHFTFHVPFVGAAMVLGGPTAGAWVAFLSTIERRELESLPWYGILANHTSMALAAIAGGVTVPIVHGLLMGITGDEGLARFVAILAGAVVLEGVSNAFAAVTVMLRDRLSVSAVLAIAVEEFGRDTLLEIAMVWVFVTAYVTVGWWSPLVLGVAVVAFRTTARPEGPDALTGLMRRREFERQLGRKIGWIRRGILRGGTLMYVDLNGFNEVNNRYLHDTGDEVLVEVANRLRGVRHREHDLVSRLMGDELALFFVDLVDVDTAMARAREIVRVLSRPIATTQAVVQIGAAVGVMVQTADAAVVPSASTLMQWAETAMFVAKNEGDPAGDVYLYDPQDPAIHRQRKARARR